MICPPAAGLSRAGRTEGHHQAGGEDSELGLVEAAGGRCVGVWGAWSMWLGCREGGWTETQHPATHGPARPLKLGMQVWTGWGCPADSSLLFFVKTIFLLCIRVQPTTNVVAEAPQRGSATRGHASALPQTPPVQAAPAGPEAPSLFGKQRGQAGRSSMMRVHGGLRVREPN